MIVSRLRHTSPTACPPSLEYGGLGCAQAFIHDLNIKFPCAASQFTLGLEFGKLGFVVSVIDKAWP